MRRRCRRRSTHSCRRASIPSLGPTWALAFSVGDALVSIRSGIGLDAWSRALHNRMATTHRLTEGMPRDMPVSDHQQSFRARKKGVECVPPSATRARSAGRACAYCGKTVRKPTREHVVPSCLYPPSKARSGVQRLTVPACAQCNSSWSDDEAHFRDVLLLAGKPNESVQELWHGKATRSFHEVDGPKRVRELLERMQPMQTPTGPRHIVFPARDERVVRVVRKVVRGLCYHHDLSPPVPDRRVWVDVMKYKVPPAFVADMHHHHREKDIFRYSYRALNEEGIHSVWLLTFFQRTEFISIVSSSNRGLSRPNEVEMGMRPPIAPDS